ncbi:MAG: VOC family protein [Rhodospirillaceae bacterium]|jgi:catechol 2,3-dioxygenase-like lactoylglutathione lyase family enzyme
MTLSRKQFLSLIGAAAMVRPGTVNAQAPATIMSRIKYATLGAPDLDAVEQAYTKWLGHTVVERSTVSQRMANSWGTPKMAGRPFVLMRPMTGEDVMIRAVETDALPGYKAMTTLGWNAFEIIVNDPDDLHRRLMEGSPFEHIGGPANLGGGSTIRAAQYIGPAGEVLYFNSETGDREKSNLPLPGEDVGRTNIVILASKDLDETMPIYRAAFGLGQGFVMPTSNKLVAEAQELEDGAMFRLGFITLRERGNAIHFDEYTDGSAPRPATDGMLPQACAMVSFNVDNLDAVDADFVAEPITEYGGMRSAVFKGPAGELVELIEADR